MRIIKALVIQKPKCLDKVVLIMDLPGANNISEYLELTFYAKNGCDYLDIYFPSVAVETLQFP